ncbi:MAG: L-threonylcarbamoyladenylate synthase [Proteobacteria bacterium]|nr:L-threonylcarbamoyladenylate synthase [Pseudomonadota bacterium]MDA0994675.1 L-threonylcarbamoyladenylate synthase [Pseudomonadota bacterium]
MARLVEIHPKDPQPRLIADVVAAIRNGELISYPTDSSYAFGCQLGDKKATDRIRRLRKTDKDHNFTLVCKDLSEISHFARVENWAYRLIKSLTPGPYTFILQASREVPKRLQNPRRRTIGLRVPDHAIAHAILNSLGEPIMSSTLSLPGDELPLTNVYEIEERIGNDIDLIVDGGPSGVEPTTVIDLSEGSIDILRRGLGDVSSLV